MLRSQLSQVHPSPSGRGSPVPLLPVLCLLCLLSNRPILPTIQGTQEPLLDSILQHVLFQIQLEAVMHFNNPGSFSNSNPPPYTPCNLIIMPFKIRGMG